MPKAGPPYSPEFRAEAVGLLRSSGKTVAELSRELGVAEPTLRRRRHQVEDEREEAARPSIDDAAPLRGPGHERHSLPEEEEDGDAVDRAPELPARSTPSAINDAGVPRRFAVRSPGKDRSMRMLARLTADAIEVGVVVVTAPARWAASGLRWYADRKDGPPRSAVEG